MSGSDAILFARLDERVKKLEHLVDVMAGEITRLQEHVDGRDLQDEILGPAPVKPKREPKAG